MENNNHIGFNELILDGEFVAPDVENDLTRKKSMYLIKHSDMISESLLFVQSELKPVNDPLPLSSQRLPHHHNQINTPHTQITTSHPHVAMAGVVAPGTIATEEEGVVAPPFLHGLPTSHHIQIGRGGLHHHAPTQHNPPGGLQPQESQPSPIPPTPHAQFASFPQAQFAGHTEPPLTSHNPPPYGDFNALCPSDLSAAFAHTQGPSSSAPWTSDIMDTFHLTHDPGSYELI
ncbi:hypothetical protein E3N88_08036 [Mikania micrantha]|uniref:Uncharacterized protein n=1 Tax=Mikania micrantha TaxID=192012 RepID=A0A5N6PH27_9ASTR|nr:hypothetical protein E3N88_08036 [Mikania micrantha]